MALHVEVVCMVCQEYIIHSVILSSSHDYISAVRPVMEI